MAATFRWIRFRSISVATNPTAGSAIERWPVIRWIRFGTVSGSATTGAAWLAAASAALCARTKAGPRRRFDDLRHLLSYDRLVLLSRSDFIAGCDWTWDLSISSDQE